MDKVREDGYQPNNEHNSRGYKPIKEQGTNNAEVKPPGNESSKSKNS